MAREECLYGCGIGEAGRLRSVEVATLTGETRQLPADILLPFFGLSMDLGPIATWGLERDGAHIAIDPATCQTSHSCTRVRPRTSLGISLPVFSARYVRMAADSKTESGGPPSQSGTYRKPHAETRRAQA